MCKAQSKVAHIKQQKYFHHLKRPGYNTEFLLYPRPFRWWRYFCCFICVTLLWALHIVIKQQFFTFIFAVLLLNLFYTYSLAKCCRPFLQQGCKFVWLAVCIVCQCHKYKITGIQFNSGQNAASYIGITSGFTRLYDQWEISCFQSVRFFSFNFDRIAVIVMSFWVYSYCAKYDVISSSILLPVSYLLMSLPSEAQVILTNQILSTSMVNINLWLRYNDFQFGKTNVHRIGILLPVPISTIFP